MQIKIDMKILIFLFIFYISNQLKIYTILMIFACIHELGHLCLGKIVGFKLNCFEIKPVGFSVSFDNQIEDYNKKFFKGDILELKKIFVYLVGPIINVILAIVIYYVEIDNVLKLDLIYVNLIIAFFNFLPVYPLDGGRILKSILCIFFGLRKSYIIVKVVSKVVVMMVVVMSSFLVLKVHNFGIAVISMYLLYIQMMESRRIDFKLKFFDLIEKQEVL